jgi:hypothetical protein
MAACAAPREAPIMLMQTELQSQVAFHLTGRRDESSLETVDSLALRPALLARYRDLTALRYDFPLVLADGGADDERVQALSGLVDRLLRDIARGDDAERVTWHVLRLERQLRALLAEGAEGSLSSLWDMAAERIGVRNDELLRDSLGRARSALKVDGALVDCNAALPARFFMHAWRVVQDAKAARFHGNVRRLIQKLSDILRADHNRSDAGRSAESLEASIGDCHAGLFDFGAMSRLLTKATPETTLPESRRTRIRGLLSVLESQRFYCDTGSASDGESAYLFVIKAAPTRWPRTASDWWSWRHSLARWQWRSSRLPANFARRGTRRCSRPTDVRGSTQRTRRCSPITSCASMFGSSTRSRLRR